MTGVRTPLKLGLQVSPPVKVPPKRVRMRRSRSLDRVGHFASRWIVGLGLVGFLVVNTGLPVVRPVAPRGKDKSKPFLCQDRPCGCMSADECLRGCVLLTARQRLAWAKANNIEAPRELIAAAAKENASHSEADHDHESELADADHDGHEVGHEHETKSCCSVSKHGDKPSDSSNACAKCDRQVTGSSMACRLHRDHEAQVVADRAVADTGTASQVDGGRSERGWRISFIVGPLAGHCRGMGPLSVLSFSCLPPVPAVDCSFDWATSDWLEPASACADSIFFSPPTRPPRI